MIDINIRQVMVNINGSKKLFIKSKRDHIDTSMIEGCKSGYTSKAQSTLSSLLNINDHHYVCVVGFSKNSDGYNHCTVNDTLALR